MPATSPTASSSCVSWLFMLSTVMCVFPRSGTTCPETSLIVCSVVEKILASLKNIHARTKNARAIPAKSNPFISSTNSSNPTAPPSGVPGNPDYSCDCTQKVPLSRASARNDAAPDDPLPVPCIEHGRLARSDTYNRLMKTGYPPSISGLLDRTRDRRPIVADLYASGLLGVEEPVEIPHRDLPHLKILPASDDYLPGTRSYLADVQRRRRRDAYSAPLSDRKVDNAGVTAKNPPFVVDDVTWLRSHLLADKTAVVPIGDKADILALRGVGDSEPPLLGDGADVRLSVLPEGEDRTRQEIPRHRPEDVGLILALVHGARKRRAFLHPGVVPCRDVVESELVREERRRVELDVGVASDAWVGRLAFAVGAHEILHDAPVEELLEVEREVRQSHPVRRVAGEEYRIGRAARAAAPLTVVQPERHGCDVVAGLLEKQGRDGRVDSPAHRGNNAPAAGSLSSVRLEHLARLAVPVLFECLVQRVEYECERMLFAGGKGSAERVLQIGLRSTGGIEEGFS